MRDYNRQLSPGLTLAQSGGEVSGAFLLLFGGIFLAIAWQVGPEPMIDAARYKTFTAHSNGRIVESWLAMEFDPVDMGQKRRWFAFAKVAPCIVAEYDGDWGTSRRRAFCGNQVKFREDLNLNMWDTLRPGVLFAWQRDASGFAIGEIRLSKTARDWLAAQPPYSTFHVSLCEKPRDGVGVGYVDAMRLPRVGWTPQSSVDLFAIADLDHQDA